MKNKFHGKGDLLYSQAKDYNGKSLAEVADLESYEGHFKNGLKWGEGVQRYAKLSTM